MLTIIPHSLDEMAPDLVSQPRIIKSFLVASHAEHKNFQA
jgi:hypothetical protein